LLDAVGAFALGKRHYVFGTRPRLQFSHLTNEQAQSVEGSAKRREERHVEHSPHERTGNAQGETAKDQEVCAGKRKMDVLAQMR
jgi:hypothetical protein